MLFRPTTTRFARTIKASLAGRAVTGLIAAVLLASGCGGDDNPAAQPSPAESTSPTEVAEPLNLTTELIRSRRDEANERLRVRVTNLGDQPVPIDGLRLIAPPFTPDPGEISGGRQLNPGQTLAYRVVHGDPECVGDDPATGTVQVEVISGDQQITLDPGESVELIQRILTITCARERVLGVVDIRLDTEWDVHSNGNEQTGTLLIERKNGGPAVTLVGVRGGINYTLDMLERDTQPVLEEGEQTLAVPVHSRGARCDGHAMGDNSKPYGFSAWLQLDGRQEVLIEFTAEDQPDNFVRLCS